MKTVKINSYIRNKYYEPIYMKKSQKKMTEKNAIKKNDTVIISNEAHKLFKKLETKE